MAKILIVEDSPTELTVMSQFLSKQGHEVLSAASAEEGIETCKREMPDLVVMDVVLPNMNGFQATRAISKDDSTKHIPVMIVSTKGMEVDQAWGMRQGARDYMVKPVKEADFISRISAILGG
ncbi:response regulator [Lysobacter soyae]|uniref:Response regulator n=1 Tax=Lysobacter soyae TaxID=2764185 RepID=A0ABX8WRK8_9GAMM|nr:response regulator [Lysobacter sp. CJ11]QYR53473.1 response regulator [Lysobacter sp. CJ11]